MFKREKKSVDAAGDIVSVLIAEQAFIVSTVIKEPSKCL